MPFPTNMKRGTRPPREQLEQIDRIVEKAFTKNPRITGNAALELVHAKGLKIGMNGIMRRLHKLRGNGTATVEVEDNTGEGGASELETVMSYTPLKSGKVRVYFDQEMDPPAAARMIRMIGNGLCDPTENL